MRSKKYICLLMAVVFALSVLFTACSSNTNKNDNDNTQANKSQNTDLGEKAKSAPAKIRFMYSDIGLGIPDDVDPGNNPFLNKIAEQANVEFTEVIRPPYTDYTTKLNLVLSSGDIPDVLFPMWSNADVEKQGMNGAFLPLNDYIAKSRYASMYTEPMIDAMKSADGNIYIWMSVPSGDPSALAGRKDLIDELNNGVIPKSPDDWYQLAKKLKQKYPESVPFSSGFGIPPTFFASYGVNIGASGANWQYTNEKYINAFEAPLCRDSVLFHKKLYDEGLLDRTFVTNKLEDYNERKWNKKLLFVPASYLGVAVYVGHYVRNNVTDAIINPIPLPIVDDPKIDSANVYSGLGLLGGTGLAIASQTKEKEGCVRLIESFLSPETLELCAWGRNGVEHTITDGKKVLNVENSLKTTYRFIYGIMRYYWDPEVSGVRARQEISLLDESVRDKVTKQFEDVLPTLVENAKKNPAISPDKFVKLSEDTMSRQSEASELSKSIILKAIIGEISMEEYDSQVTAFLKKYSFITDEYNKKLAEVKQKWRY